MRILACIVVHEGKLQTRQTVAAKDMSSRDRVISNR